MAKKLTAAQRRKLLAKPASSLSASELDIRRDLIKEGRLKTTGPGKKKKKATGTGMTAGGVGRLLRSKGRLE
jgi:hypothetical protein